ncbi:MAG: cobalt-precorrin-5B (C(1))-methyltransferase [Bacteroidaceae bacterium]|nr:cobalt-precorrin-5B (C(1))-methyltransferase [Bacteroidaceae bacterium]
MILVFGGTTEGRRAVEVLEEAGSPYFYSTKTGEQEVTLHNGQRIAGAMDYETMLAFCQQHAIRLIVDAAHPFASQLHETITKVANSMLIHIVRYERIYPPRDPAIEWIDDYSQIPTNIHSLFATTGVQHIHHLKYLEAQGVKVIYRILNRESSIRLAHEQGATNAQLCFYPQMAKAEAILIKESGETGGFSEKVEAAKGMGMRIIAIRRPAPPMGNDHWIITNGPYGLRRAIEKLLPKFYPLHSGLTTGTCATAATIAATKQLLSGEQPKEVSVILPNGETISVPVCYGNNYAYCIKEAGDDPDVTNGIEIRASSFPLPEEGEGLCCSDLLPLRIGLPDIEVFAGDGIGRFTLPGFDFPVGEPAVNRVPREMIRENLANTLRHSVTPSLHRFSIVLSVPNGEEIARRTFNPRLGIEGGISIIGVSGIVKPYSEEAFIQSICKCMEVAKASGSERVVIGSGMKSEQQLRALYPHLPQQAFVQYGNYIGETLKMANAMGINHVTLGIMIGKAVKLAQGHLDTHSRRVTMDKAFIAQLLHEAKCPSSANLFQSTQLTVARKLWDILSPDESDRFSKVLIAHCYEHCSPLLPNGELTILLLKNE